VSSVPNVIGNIVDCGAGAPGTSRDLAGLVASEYLRRRTSEPSNPESGCARSLSVGPASRLADLDKSPTADVPGRKWRPDHFGNFEMADY
jgi:hypothetical protein